MARVMVDPLQALQLREHAVREVVTQVDHDDRYAVGEDQVVLRSPARTPLTFPASPLVRRRSHTARSSLPTPRSDFRDVRGRCPVKAGWDRTARAHSFVATHEKPARPSARHAASAFCGPPVAARC